MNVFDFLVCVLSGFWRTCGLALLLAFPCAGLASMALVRVTTRKSKTINGRFH